MCSAIRLNAPAGNLPSLMAAVDAGADSVYFGFRSPTNLRNLPGLNLSVDEAAEGVSYAHRRGVEAYVTVNTHPLDHQLAACYRAVDDAVEIGADAVVVADWAVLDHARRRHPGLRIHLSCLAGAADAAAIRFYHHAFDVRCVVLPRVLSVDQIAALRRKTNVLLEVMVFGVLCANYEGRCLLSSYITGVSANSSGACAPAEFVEFEETDDGRTTLKLNGVPINEFDPTEQRTYPTPCKAKYYNPATGRRVHAFQNPCCLNALALLPELAAAGVDAVKIEGRQRSLAYVRLVTGVWRSAIDALSQPDVPQRNVFQNAEVERVLEGGASTLGALSGG